MPVKQMITTRPPAHDALVDELLREWSNPDPAASEPVILEEPGRAGKLEQVYVVWSKWSSIDRIERSEIIMDAALKRLSQEDALEITFAMGLTPDEARGMGIPF